MQDLKKQILSHLFLTIYVDTYIKPTMEYNFDIEHGHKIHVWIYDTVQNVKSSEMNRIFPPCGVDHTFCQNETLLCTWSIRLLVYYESIHFPIYNDD